MKSKSTATNEQQAQPGEVGPCPWCGATTDAEDEWGSLITHKPSCYWRNIQGNPIGRVRVNNSDKERWNTRASTTPAVESVESALPDGYWPGLLDRGDGVKGHYCIGRLIRIDEIYWEFWNHGKWASAGQVFVGKEAAMEAMAQVRATYAEGEGRQ